MTTNPSVMQEQLEQITRLVGQLQRSSDPAAQAAAQELVQALLDLHSAGFARVLELIAHSVDGTTLLDACAQDDLVGHLLLLHGLHPEDLEIRVCRALERVRSELQRHGSDVLLLGATDGIVRLQVQGDSNGCVSSQSALRSTIEEAIYDVAPEVTAITITGLPEPKAPPVFVNLEIPDHLPQHT